MGQPAEDTGCRRCTECEGEEHHWLPDLAELRVPCKHCDATREWDDEDDPSCEDEDEEPVSAPVRFEPPRPPPHKVEAGQLYQCVEHNSRRYNEVVRVVLFDEKDVEAVVVVPGFHDGSHVIGEPRTFRREYFTYREWWPRSEGEIDERDRQPFCELNSSHAHSAVTFRIRTPSGIALVLHDGEGNLAAESSGGYFGTCGIREMPGVPGQPLVMKECDTCPDFARKGGG